MGTTIETQDAGGSAQAGPAMIEQLLAAGVHFGHQTRRWNPKMRRFIFAERNGIHIIDLQKTLRQLQLAQTLVRETVQRGEQVLFVCTKRQLSALVKAEAERAGAYSVTERWLGGLLTNWTTVKKQIKKLKDLEAGSEQGGDFENYTKKEQLMMTRERDKLSKNFSGIKNMGRLPGLMFVVDSKKEHIAVDEARRLGIPVVAIVDTNADPDLITVPIAGNDDAIRSVELIAHTIAETISEARRDAPVRRDDDEAETTTYSSERGSERADRGDRNRGDRGPRDGQGGGQGGGQGAPSAGGDDRTRRPRRRRARPDAIAAARRPGDVGPDGGSEGEAGSSDAGSAEAAPPAADNAPQGGEAAAE
jgi:small subunit ribosomal protein S2